MSYILDALNKAERERRAKAAPASPFAHDFQRRPRQRAWIIAGALVCCTAAALWLFLPSLNTVSQTPDAVRAGGRAEDAALPVAPAELSQPESPAQSVSAAVSPEVDAQAASAGPVTQIVKARQKPGKAPSAAARAEALGRQSRPEPEALPLSDDPAPQVQTVPDAPLSTPQAGQEKPMSLREAVDGMTMTILMYAEAKAGRRVYINGRKYLEGDYVDGRYLVESITLQGVVLSYEGEQAVLRPGPK